MVVTLADPRPAEARPPQPLPVPEGPARPPAPRWQVGLVLGLVVAVTAGLHFYRLGDWSWGEDEVHSLVELGLVQDRGGDPYLPRLVPLWFQAQGWLLGRVPVTEFNTRLLAAVCGVLTVAVAFVFAERYRGLPFACGLVLLMVGGQLLVWLGQQNRFYTPAALLLMATLAAVWSRRDGWWLVPAAAGLAVLAVLAHNFTFVVFGIYFIAACLTYPLGWLPRPVFVRLGAVAAATGLLYGLYLRPILAQYKGGWTTDTPVAVSFAAQVGLPVLALALLGAWAALVQPEERRRMGWWGVALAGVLLFVLVYRRLMPAWNPRYSLMLMPPLWVLAAYGLERLARGLGSPAGLGVYACAGLLLLPKLLSHYQDGTRYDFRGAARMVAEQARPDQAILSNWPVNLRVYLPPELKPRLEDWEENGRPLPESEFYLVAFGNTWFPAPRFPGRRTEAVGEVVRRRFDEQSFAARVYRVSAAAPGAARP